MIAKCLLLAFASPFVLSNSLPETYTIVNHPAVVQVRCADGLGTAFRVGEHGLVSVNHVTRMKGCTINGEPVRIRLADVARDVSFGRIASNGPGLTVNCGGIKDGERLYAIGYARGRPVQRLVTVRGSDFATKAMPWGSFSTVVGAEYFIPGMSGGPLLNTAGEAVGTVNGYHPLVGVSFAQSLSDTAICTGEL